MAGADDGLEEVGSAEPSIDPISPNDAADGLQPREATSPETAEISASISRQVTFATHQNDVPVIADLVVRNKGGEPLENLQLELVCEPPIVAGRIWQIDRVAPGGELRLRDRKVALAGGMLSELTERRRADLRINLWQGEEVLTEWRQELLGLAHNEWGGGDTMPELLAAFVMPNDPAISTVLKEAGEILRRAGKQPSLDGYQSRSRQRIWQIASAIWSAVAARRLVYVEPPASFERQGQKIRTPGEVWNNGLATCLDTTVLFAAALEQAGLNPVVTFTKGHSFCGLWLQPQELPTLICDDCTELRKYEALKELVVFETTLVTNEPPAKFSRAVEAASRFISEPFEEDFIYALDLRRARQQQITPLSLVVTRADDASPSDVLVEALEEAPALPAFDLGVDDGTKPDTPETRLDHWKRKLLDLTKRNRLLNLKPSKTAIKLICSDPAVLEDKLADGKKITVTPLAKLTDRGGQRDDDLVQHRLGRDFTDAFAADALERNEVLSDMDEKDLDAGLVQLYRKAKSDLREGGANTLFLALGILKWKQSPDEERSYRAPLVLVPVTLERRSAASKVKIVHHDDEPVFNLTLLEMLRQDFDLRMPLVEGELPKDESGVDVPLIWEAVRKAVRDIPGFELVEEVVLSTFSFAKYLMWKDLSDRTEALKESPFVRHLIDNPRDPYSASAAFLHPDEIDEKIHPSELFLPLPADSSQIVAVYASANGGDFVLEGPPGTGKSQTIANIIAHNLGHDRRVLFVSEKMAALEVVYRRLVEKGLGSFCLELHSSKANKKDVLNQLGMSWYGRRGLTSKGWQAETERLKCLREELNGLVAALHRPGATGVSPRAAIGRAVRFQDLHRLRLSWEGRLEADRAGGAEGLEQLEDIANRLGQVYSQIGGDEKRAFSIIQKTDWSNAWQATFVDACRALIGTIDMLLAATSRFANELQLPDPGENLARIRGLSGIATEFSSAARNNLGFALGGDGGQVLENMEAALTALEVYNEKKKNLSRAYGDSAIGEAQVGIWKQRWQRAQQKIWPFGALARFNIAGQMRKVCDLDKRPNPGNDLPHLDRMQKLQADMASAAAELPPGAPWRSFGTDVARGRECIRAAKSLREGIARVAKDSSELLGVRDGIRRLCEDGQDLLQPGMPLTEAGTALVDAISAFENALATYCKEAETESSSSADLHELRSQAQGVLELQPRINTWCRWQAVRREAEASGLSEVVDALENDLVLAEDATEAFKTAYCLWLAGRLVDDRPELRTFSALAHEEKIKAFCELDQKLADLSIDYIKAKLSGDVPSPEDTDRPAAYGVLARELQKKMRHMPVRQLVGELGDVVTALTPCLLMSPLSVAQFLSAESRLFDLVVFDEASQITVWDAIGAIARGKNVIVVGDPKQMPPTSFFERGASEDEGDEANLGDDLESILDEALAASVKWHRLTGHYRSRHESLIAFSNHRYYGGDLVTYPSNETKESAVHFVQVDGLYQRGKGRTNPDEAKAVVAEVLRRLRDQKLNQLSIGIVTLNSEQQRLIDDLLDQARRDEPDLEKFFGDDADEPVFVKNLETVQGDQRDVILLSVGYGPDAPGARTMSMNFGPLNRKGGERRLNVAITRATTEVIIFASFDPSMIDLTRTSAAAVRDLKHYLEFADRGPSALGEAVQSVGGAEDYESDFEKAVAEGLRRRGWDVHTQIGVSKFRIDLGVVHPDYPGRYLAGIECDGAAYHSSPSARDRDKVRQAILENLSWSLIRVWSTDFFIDQSGTLERVHQRLNALLESDRAASVSQEEDAGPTSCEVEGQEPTLHPSDQHVEEEGESENTPSDAMTAPDNLDESGLETEEIKELAAEGTPFAVGGQRELYAKKPSEVGLPALSAEQFYDPSYLRTLRTLSLQLIDQQGPITFHHVATQVARLHGFQRTGRQIKQQVWEAIGNNRAKSRSPDQHTVFWPHEVQPSRSIDFRGLTVGGVDRSWGEVSYPEKFGLALRIAETGPHDDAARVMADQIGIGRLKAKTRDELEALLQEAATSINAGARHTGD